MGSPEEVLFESEEHKTLSEIAAFLRAAADGLEQGVLVLTQDERRVEVRPPGEAMLEIEYEVEDDEHELEIEIKWRAQAAPAAEDEEPDQDD
jgi:amphi-Trp domain-containing protein